MIREKGNEKEKEEKIRISSIILPHFMEVQGISRAT
jgi:hypothetical protein